MSSIHPAATITAIRPLWAVEGGRVTIEGTDLPVDGTSLPEIRVGEVAARIVFASRREISIVVPSGLDGGRTPVRVEGVPGETAFIEVGEPIVTGVHQVDNPVFDRAGNLYVTHSGTRGQETPVSIYRVRPDGVQEPFVSGIVNATSMAFDTKGALYVSSRFESTISRVSPDGRVETVATDLGVACGLAFGHDGTLYVGDRSGTVFRVKADGRASSFVTLPPSIAAFHLAVGPDDRLYVTAPTLAPHDNVYRIANDGTVDVLCSSFGRPQGLAFDAGGTLYVVEALAGSSGLYRFCGDVFEHALAGPALVGVAIDPGGGLVVCSNETVYRLRVNVKGRAN